MLTALVARLFDPTPAAAIRSLRVVMIACGCQGLPPAAVAQTVPDPNEYTLIVIGGGLGPSLFDVNCTGCQGRRQSALSGTIRLGGAVTDRLLLNAEAFGLWKETGRLDETVSAFLGTVYYYPFSRWDRTVNPAMNGLLVKAGAGYGRYRSDDHLDEIALGGVVGYLGAGFEAQVAGNLSLSPSLNLLLFPSHVAEFNGADLGERMSMSLLQFALVANLYFGIR